MSPSLNYVWLFVALIRDCGVALRTAEMPEPWRGRPRLGAGRREPVERIKCAFVVVHSGDLMTLLVPRMAKQHISTEARSDVLHADTEYAM